MDGNGRSCKDTSDGKLGGSGDSGEGLGDQGLGEKERKDNIPPLPTLWYCVAFIIRGNSTCFETEK